LQSGKLAELKTKFSAPQGLFGLDKLKGLFGLDKVQTLRARIGRSPKQPRKLSLWETIQSLRGFMKRKRGFRPNLEAQLKKSNFAPFYENF
jgi:hypothetical protein